MSRRLAVFASGSGTNLQSLIDRLNGRRNTPAEVVLVVSDREQAKALARAVDAGIPGRVLPVRGRAPQDVAAETLDLLDELDIDLIALAGYLRLVPAPVIVRFTGRIVNIHPALLPAFGGPGMYGMRVHQAVLEAGCSVTGVTVHHVTERYDEGRPIAQWPVPVLYVDDPHSLAERVLRVEHVLYPLAIEKLARDLAERPGSSAASRPVAAAPMFGWTTDHAKLELLIRNALNMEDLDL